MKILNKLTIKYLLMNKKRTIVTIIGVILSTSLMVGIGLIVSSFRDSLIKDAISYNGDQHLIVYGLNNEEINKLYDYEEIKEIKRINYIDEYEINNQYYNLTTIDEKILNRFKIEGNLPSNNNEILTPKYIKSEINEELDINNKKYKIVGKYGDISDLKLPYEFMNYIYTVNLESENNAFLITFKNPKNAHIYIEQIINDLNISYENYSINTELLALMGSIKYKNIMDSITKIIIIVLALISVGCIIVIYNSFAISVMERKKQFGIFSSIGTTKIQLLKTVYFEAFIISLIGIPLGILAAYLGIGVVIKITNNLLNITLLELSTYPIFIIIPIIFMIITIILSALVPSITASRISPIQAIRMNDDIKIKSKKVKTPGFIKKIFGIEGDLALKNIKRNKKKYRVTIISLFISIVLFITFSSFINYIIGGIKYATNIPDIDIYIMGNVSEKNREVISKNNDIKEYLYLEELSVYNDESGNIKLFIIDDNSYNKLLKSIGEETRKPVVPNNYKVVEYSDNKRITKVKQKFDKKEDIKLCFNDKCNIEFKDYHLPDSTYDMLDSFMSGDLYIFLTKDMLKNYDDFNEIDSLSRYNIFIKTDKDKEVETFIKTQLNLDEDGTGNGVMLYNIKEQYRLEKNIITVIKIFVYGFIGLVTLIGVTSVINTINTSIALRRKEFAILRSIGLTSKGFNKMIYFESLFFGLKSLLYALPVSGIIIYFIHNSMSGVIEYESIMLPLTQMLYAIIGVFVIVLVTMLYASRKIKKDNILEAIREENV